MLLYTRLAPPKEPKRRSRAGCSYCKEKKKKCDEKRPQCARCAEHGVECFYEAVKPRQRRRREPSLLDTTSARYESGSWLSARRFSEASHGSIDTDLLSWGDSDHHNPLSYGLDDAIVISPSESVFSGFDFSWSGLSRTRAPDIINEADIVPEPTAVQAGSIAHKPSIVHGIPAQPCIPPAAQEEDPDGKAEPCSTTDLVPRTKSHHPGLAMIAPCPVGSPLADFCAPAFSEFSEQPNRRALVDHFCNVLSHLIVFREETGNPFQQLVLPLTRRCSPVMNAIYALASAHLEYRGVQNPEKSLYFHHKAIQGVAQMIQEREKVSRNEILAAIMLLVYYECLVQKGRSNIVAGHLRGALTILCSRSEPLDPTSVFLERAFRFYDVITALSNGTAPLSAAPAQGFLHPVSPLGAPAASPLNNVDTLLGMATTLWPIIHRLSSLLPLRAALDAAPPDKVEALSAEFEKAARDVEEALTSWQPILPEGYVADGSSTNHLAGTFSGSGEAATSSETNRRKWDMDKNRIASIHNNALAYRHAALAYLYRSVRRYPRSHPLVRAHARLALGHCAATARHAGPMSALLWPMFVAACEVGGVEDRRLAREVFVAVDRRQGMRNIERAWEVVGEVWKRGDMKGDEEEVKDKPMWKAVSEEMGVNVVFG